MKLDKIDVDKLNPVRVDLSKLHNIKNNEIVKETVYEKLVVRVNVIDTSVFALKIKYDTDKSHLEKKIPDKLVDLLK